MWLLEVPQFDYEPEHVNLKLVEFLSGQVDELEYAILSHTWGSDEVLFEDVKQGTAQARKGYEKVQATILQARLDGYDYVWIDSCCIQKSSSAELQEAINSMWAWYRNSEVCYIHLADVVEPEWDNGIEQSEWRSSFLQSRYFSRGWTLQELIAPTRKTFFSRHWKAVGQIVKPDPFLQPDESLPDLTAYVSQATRIERKILRGQRDLQSISIATRMSWMAGRQCSREEDHAYSLLGIFDVSIPLLYGEGSRAFKRLQEEILRQSDDTSIFRWQQTTYHRRKAMRGLLADSADCFMGSDRVDGASFEDRLRALPYSMTNKGLSIQLPMRQISGSVWLGVLDCSLRNQKKERDVVYLWRLLDDAHHFVRIFPHRLASMSSFLSAEPMQILVRQGLEHSGMWKEDSSSTDGLQEAWMNYCDPISHVTVDLAVATTQRFDLEYGQRRINRVDSGFGDGNGGLFNLSTFSHLPPASHGPYEFAFQNGDAALQSDTEHSDMTVGSVRDDLRSTASSPHFPPIINGEVRRMIDGNLDEINKQAFPKPLPSNHINDRSADDIALLSQMIHHSDLSRHLNDQCADSQAKKLNLWRDHSHAYTYVRSELCLLFTERSTSDRIAVIISRDDPDSISIRAVPLGNIVNIYDIEVDGTRIGFVDGAEDDNKLQVHMTLKIAVIVHEKEGSLATAEATPDSDLSTKDQCRACTDLAAFLKPQRRKFGKIGRLSLLGDAHQSEKQVTLTISSAKEKKKTVGFKAEVVEI